MFKYFQRFTNQSLMSNNLLICLFVKIEKWNWIFSQNDADCLSICSWDQLWSFIFRFSKCGDQVICTVFHVLIQRINIFYNWSQKNTNLDTIRSGFLFLKLYLKKQTVTLKHLEADGGQFLFSVTLTDCFTHSHIHNHTSLCSCGSVKVCGSSPAGVNTGLLDRFLCS